MWKTLNETPLAASISCTLCPHCDSLGPHLITGEDLPEDTWLACIDCGATLGWLTPQGIRTLDTDPQPMGPMAAERSEPIDWERIMRQALVDPGANRGSMSDTSTTLTP
jgi:hypothetical protein